MILQRHPLRMALLHVVLLADLNGCKHTGDAQAGVQGKMIPPQSIGAEFLGCILLKNHLY